tara:strand:- start:662 stop:949 length:288 start_codon:yes stop_codon:yes gene_type:complete
MRDNSDPCFKKIVPGNNIVVIREGITRKEGNGGNKRRDKEYKTRGTSGLIGIDGDSLLCEDGGGVGRDLELIAGKAKNVQKWSILRHSQPAKSEA